MKTIGMLLLAAWTAQAQLTVTVSPVKTTGQKAIVPLTLENKFSEKIESARAAVFLSDEQGKVVSHSVKWVIGGSADKPGLAAGATNAFHFVVTSDKSFATTNLTANVSFNRIVLEGGKLADAAKDVQIQTSQK